MQAGLHRGVVRRVEGAVVVAPHERDDRPITVVLAATDFPNGGGGFLAHSESSLGSGASIRRPAIAETDPAYFRYTIVFATLMFLLALWHVRSKAGRAWEAIRQSDKQLRLFVLHSPAAVATIRMARSCA